MTIRLYVFGRPCNPTIVACRRKAGGRPPSHPEQLQITVHFRVFTIDMEQCPQCGDTLKIIAAIEDPTVMAMILTHLGLSIRAPPHATFVVIQSTPNGPIPTDPRFTPVQPLSRQFPLTFTRARRQTGSKFGTEGRSMARKVPDPPILDRGLACLTTRLTHCLISSPCTTSVNCIIFNLRGRCVHLWSPCYWFVKVTQANLKRPFI